jgi:hypothetical protein
MKMLFLIGIDGDVIPISSDVIGHIDKPGKGIIGESLLYTKNALTIKLKGTPKENGMEINRQLQDFHEVDYRHLGDLRGQ